jgi:hypothetical protein
VGLLDVDNWPIFIRFDQRTGIQEEVAERINAFVNACGFRFIYFDGAEDVNRPYWFNIGYAMGRVWDALDHKPVFAEGAAKTHYDWHIMSRGNAFDHFRPEEMKKAVDSISIPAAQYNAASFTGIDFGWIAYDPPSGETVGIQPDMIEYILSHSVGYNSYVSLVGVLENLKKHPRTKDNLEVFRMWEEAKRAGFFTQEQREALKKPGAAFTLLRNEKKEYELLPCEEIPVAGGKKEVRAVLFRRHGETWVSYWHTSGSGALELPVPAGKVTLYERPGEKVRIKKDTKDKTVIPVEGRRYLCFQMNAEEVKKIMARATLTGAR